MALQKNNLLFSYIAWARQWIMLISDCPIKHLAEMQVHLTDSFLFWQLFFLSLLSKTVVNETFYLQELNQEGIETLSCCYARLSQLALKMSLLAWILKSNCKLCNTVIQWTFRWEDFSEMKPMLDTGRAIEVVVEALNMLSRILYVIKTSNPDRPNLKVYNLHWY